MGVASQLAMGRNQTRPADSRPSPLPCRLAARPPNIRVSWAGASAPLLSFSLANPGNQMPWVFLCPSRVPFRLPPAFAFSSSSCQALGLHSASPLSAPLAVAQPLQSAGDGRPRPRSRAEVGRAGSQTLTAQAKATSAASAKLEQGICAREAAPERSENPCGRQHLLRSAQSPETAGRGDEAQSLRSGTWEEVTVAPS